MLLRFRAGNHRSLHQPQELSLVASSLDDDPAGLIDCKAAKGGRLVPAAVLYGANASGKSNVIDALGWMRQVVLYSHSRGQPGEKISREPFALSPEAASEPSSHDIDFVVDGTRYHYGFEVTDDAFTSEWLYSFPNARRQMLFERSGQSFDFGRNLKGHNHIIADLTRPNSLFLSAAVQNSQESLSEIANFFKSMQHISDRNTDALVIALRSGEREFEQRIVYLLHNIGTGVVGYRNVEEFVPDDIRHVGKNLMTEASKILNKQQYDESVLKILFEERFVRLQLAHRALGVGDVFLNYL